MILERATQRGSFGKARKRLRVSFDYPRDKGRIVKHFCRLSGSQGLGLLRFDWRLNGRGSALKFCRRHGLSLAHRVLLT